MEGNRFACVEFAILKDGEDEAKLEGICCFDTISLNTLTAILNKYPRSSGYKVILNGVVDMPLEWPK